MDEAKKLYQMKAAVMKAVAHPIRLAIVDILRGGEKCVCKITEAVGAERSNVSRHLAVMVKAGILASRKEGLMVYYNLRTPCVLDFFTCVEGVLREQLLEDQAVLSKL